MDELSYIPVGATQATLVAGSNISTTLAGVTSGHFGRTAKDANILYLATSGGWFPLSLLRFIICKFDGTNCKIGLALPINGTVTVAGSIVKIDTTGF